MSSEEILILMVQSRILKFAESQMHIVDSICDVQIKIQLLKVVAVFSSFQP